MSWRRTASQRVRDARHWVAPRSGGYQARDAGPEPSTPPPGRAGTSPARLTWEQKQQAASPSRYYGDGGTIHGSSTIDIQMVDGTIVAVWFRCQALPFTVSEPFDKGMPIMDPGCIITGVEVRDVEVRDV